MSYRVLTKTKDMCEYTSTQEKNDKKNINNNIDKIIDKLVLQGDTNMSPLSGCFLEVMHVFKDPGSFQFVELNQITIIIMMMIIFL